MKTASEHALRFSLSVLVCRIHNQSCQRANFVIACGGAQYYTTGILVGNIAGVTAAKAIQHLKKVV